MRIPWLRLLPVFVLCVALSVALQWRANAFSADFEAVGGDEAAHFVTGLMIRDYLVHGLGSNPLAFAERFYVSYPKVAFGIWPPLFHLVEGVWFVIVPPSRLSALALIASLMALMATMLYWIVFRAYGPRWALSGAVGFTLLPLTAATASFFGVDSLVALLMFTAALSWGRFLQWGDRRHAVWFGVLAGLALLTKYNALVLALVPPFTVVLSRRWGLLKRKAFWVPAAIVIALAGPWYAATWRLVNYAAEHGPDPMPLMKVWSENTSAVVSALGVLLLFAAISAARPHSRAERGLESSLAALVASTVIFHTFIYQFAQDRYFLVCLPATVFLAIAAMIWIRRRTGRLPFVLAASAVVLFIVGAQLRTPALRTGIADAARYVSSLGAERILISSHGAGEGAFIAESALQGKRPRHVILRSSKVLARSTWMHDQYTLLCSKPEDVEARLDALRVDVVVVDHDTRPQLPHHPVLTWALAGHRKRWRLDRTFHRLSWKGRHRLIHVYRRAADYREQELPVEVDMRHTLGRSLKMVSYTAPGTTNPAR